MLQNLWRTLYINYTGQTRTVTDVYTVSDKYTMQGENTAYSLAYIGRLMTYSLSVGAP